MALDKPQAPFGDRRRPSGPAFERQIAAYRALYSHPSCQQFFASAHTGSYFYANENNEPHHIHVQRERMLAKFWLQPVAVASSTGFPAQELNKLLRLVEDHQQKFVEAWNEFFGA